MELGMENEPLKKGYKRSEVGVIPEDWDIAPLPVVAWFQEGPGLRNWQFKKSGMKVINVTNLEDGGINLDRTDRHISLEEFKKTYCHFEIQANDIVMASSGNSYCKTSVVRESDLPLMMNTSVIRFKPVNGYDYHFLLAYLTSQLFKEQIDLLITGGAQPNFGPYHLKKIVLPIPRKEEQRAIATGLSDADALIAALDKQIAKKRAIKTAAMQQLLTGKKRLPGFGDGKEYKKGILGVIPKDWAITSLGHFSAYITKGSTPTTYGFKWVKDGIIFLRSECVSEKGLDLSQSMFISSQAHSMLKRSEVCDGDILITITGNVGRVIYLKGLGNAANINQHIARIRLIDQKIDARFIFHYLSQNSIRKYYNTITTGQAYPQISLKQVRDTMVPVPALSEQKAIATILTDMDTEIAALETRRTKTQSIKQAMMQELLTGRTRLI